MRSMMSYQAKRELLVQIAPRYLTATHTLKSRILDEFIAATGYDRKYAIQLLSKPLPSKIPPAITRTRAPKYGPEVQQALKIAWAATNFICAKRLVPFLPALVSSLELHGHLTLSEPTRQQLLNISPATADRILQSARIKEHPRGISTTKAGKLLKHQVPIRTFAEWNEVKPGFLEIDLVAHCGNLAEGSFLYTLTLTDVATGWTECQALVHRSKEMVIAALERVAQLLPFPMLGIDSDNGSEFLNQELIDYCARKQLTFTRGRAYRKNDQCFVEQKNGAVVRQLVGYDRFEGEAAWQQLKELYQALRFYINYFQPSMKLQAKRREGSAVYRQYDAARTPLQRLKASGVLGEEEQRRLSQQYQTLDPVWLLKQVEKLQDALWQHAVLRSTAEKVRETPAPSLPTVRCELGKSGHSSSQEVRQAAQITTDISSINRKNHKTGLQVKKQKGRGYRHHLFSEVAEELKEWIKTGPSRTVKSLLEELQERYPGQYPDAQFRTLHRRVEKWRKEIFIQNDEKVTQDTQKGLVGEILPPTITVVPLQESVVALV